MGKKRPGEKRSDAVPEIRYLTTDLDLACERDLAPLVSALAAAGVESGFSAVRAGDGSWCATFNPEDQLDEPEASMTVMLDAIDALAGDARALWSECTLREFNIGYDCGGRPWAFNNGLTNRMLHRTAAVGASLRISLYPPVPDK